MKIVGINTVNFGSTGRIMINTLNLAEKKGHKVYAAYRKHGSSLNTDISNSILINFDNKVYSADSVLQYFTGYIDCFSHLSTHLLLNKLNKIRPDIIHLHNLHGRYLNIKMLFKWIKKHNIKVIWTFHDCWPFTGQCPYYDIVKCEKWKSQCYNCPQYMQYPATYIDKTKSLYKIKKKCFTGIENITIVAPSNWLAGQIRQSFFKDCDIRVIHNGIDLDTFKPSNSNLREKLNLENKKIILGCASPFSERKGFDVFFKLAQLLNEDYAIVLVGLTKEQLASLPDGIIGIERTSNASELAQLYTMADVFVNPTREEVLGLVNIESLACGTPVVTFNSGGSPETIDETCGISVEKDDVEALVNAIHQVFNGEYTKENCLKRSKLFDMNDKLGEYVKLYDEESYEFKSTK